MVKKKRRKEQKRKEKGRQRGNSQESCVSALHNAILPSASPAVNSFTYPVNIASHTITLCLMQEHFVHMQFDEVASILMKTLLSASNQTKGNKNALSQITSHLCCPLEADAAFVESFLPQQTV